MNLQPVQRKLGDGTVISTEFITEKKKDSLKKAIGNGFVEASDFVDLISKDKQTNLGLVRAWGEHCTLSHDASFINDLIDNRAIIEIDQDQDGVSYYEQVASMGNKILNIVSDYGDKIGYNRSLATFTANFAPREGDVIVNDPLYGGSLLVSYNQEIVDMGNGEYEFQVELTDSSNFEAYESRDKWINTQVLITNNFRPELGTNAAGLNYGNEMSTIKNFFRIGDEQQVDIEYSDRAGILMSTMDGSQLKDEAATAQIKALSGKYFHMNQRSENGSMFSIAVPALYYALFERAWGMTSTQLFSFKGINQTGKHNSVYAPKGIWWQIKDDCPNIQYSNDATFKLALRRMSDDIFGDISVEDRELVLEGGKGFGEKLYRIFSKQFDRIPIVLDQEALPGKILTGSLNNITINPVIVKSAYLEGIGMVKFNHNPSFDYSSKNVQFKKDGNLSKGTNSAIIRDAGKLYDKAAAMSKAKLYDNLAFANEYKGSNIVIVKRKGDDWMEFGYEKGRSRKGGQGSSKQYKHSNYVSIGSMGALVVDKSKIYLMEEAD